MTRDDLALHQEKSAASDLFVLYSMCLRRFVRALNLLELRRGAVNALVNQGTSEPVDLSPLLGSWRILCRRYLDEIYDPQMNLFVDPVTEPLGDWSRFVHHQLFPTLVQDDEVVRNVLRAVGVLPRRSDGLAADAVYARLTEMTLPTCRPPWAPEECEN